MANESLVFPEEYSQEIVDILLAGVHVLKNNLSPTAVEQVTKWCDETQDYLNDMEELEGGGLLRVWGRDVCECF